MGLIVELTKRTKYTASLKLKVIKQAKDSNNCAVARTLNITEKIVRHWRKDENAIKNVSMKICFASDDLP